MTGTDPAKDAADRAWDATKTTGVIPDENPWEQSIAAAREALKPIRALHRPMTDDELRETWPGMVGGDRVLCVACSDDDRYTELRDCATAQLVYTTTELENPHD